MSRTRLILLGLLAVVGRERDRDGLDLDAGVGIGSCSKVSTTPGYCVEGAPLESASEEAAGTSGSSILKATIAGTTAEIKCASGKSAGFIEGGTAGTAGKSQDKNYI